MLRLRILPSQCFQTLNKERPKESQLFHYTTAAGLMGILGSPQNKGLSLWATDIRYLNDTSEFQLGLKLGREVMGELLVAETDNTRKKVLQCIQEDIEKINDPVFVVSFSERDDTLSQWRAYGGESGYSLGWDFDALKAQANQNQKPYQWLLAKCIYDQEAQRKAMTGILMHHLEQCFCPDGMLHCLLDLRPDLTEEMQFNAVILAMRSVIRRYAATFKHKGFQEENEWRLISPWPLKFDDAMIENLLEALPAIHPKVYQAQGIKYRPGRSGIVPYVEFSLSAQNDTNSLLASITVGPNQHPILAKDATYSLCMSKNVLIDPARIHSSGIPYRSW